ncbi:hypothetical protein E1287_29175 [Actinomadura sp. KC06]|nr:hypothetical protein E1287_29175 [Actinomadura sp. KC06]
MALAASNGDAGAGSGGRAATASSPATSTTPSASPTSPQPASASAPNTQPSTQPTAQSPLSSPGPITNAASGLCIDTDGPQGPGVQVQVRKCANFSGQEWRYDQTTHHLANPPSGLCLDTAGPPPTTSVWCSTPAATTPAKAGTGDLIEPDRD